MRQPARAHRRALASAACCSARTSTPSRTRAPIEPVLVDGGWESAGDTILGADNKAAVAMLLELARRAALEGSPVGVELLFTVSEERALAGAKAFDARTAAQPRSATSSTTRRRSARSSSPRRPTSAGRPSFTASAAHAGHPARGRPQRDPRRREGDRRDAARAASTPRRPRTSRSIAAAASPGRTSSPSAARVVGEARSLDDARVEAVVAEIVAAFHDAANDPSCECDVDVIVERLFEGYRLKPSSRAVAAAERALRALRLRRRARIVTGGGVGRQRVRSRRRR